MRSLAMSLVALALVAAPAAAEPATTRTPNLTGTWLAPGGSGMFSFLHRVHAPGGTVVVYPTFHLSAGVLDWLALGAQYASKAASPLAIEHEAEIFAGQRLLDEDAGAPVSLALREAWNTKFGSADGEVNVSRTLGPVQLHGSARLLGNYLGGNGPLGQGQRVTAGLGASWALTPRVRLAADAAYPVVTPLQAAPATTPGLVWGAGLQVVVPNSPHTMALQVSNAASGTTHGQAVGTADLRYGFDFTIPFGFARRQAEPAAAAAPASPPPGGEDAGPARRTEAAEAFFASRCAGCHGAAGQGAFGPDLTKVEGKGDAAISKRILEGSPKGMPPFAGQLSDGELADLVTYVKGL